MYDAIAAALTSFRFGEGFVQIEDHLVDKVADIGTVQAAHEQLPVVRIAFRRRAALDRGHMPDFERDLHRHRRVGVLVASFSVTTRSRLSVGVVKRFLGRGRALFCQRYLKCIKNRVIYRKALEKPIFKQINFV